MGVGICVLSGVVAVGQADRPVAKPLQVGFSFFCSILVSSGSASSSMVSLMSLSIHLSFFFAVKPHIAVCIWVLYCCSCLYKRLF